MKTKLLALIFLICTISLSTKAQVNFSHYNTMYNVIKDSLQIDKAYVSDSIRESEFAGFHIVERLMPIDTLVSIIMEGPQAEYSELLHSKFNTIEDINTQINLCDNLIFFSFLYKSYISADVYLCVRTTKKTDIFPFPQWGGYHEMYSFLFQIKGDSIVFIDKIQFHEI